MHRGEHAVFKVDVLRASSTTAINPFLVLYIATYARVDLDGLPPTFTRQQPQDVLYQDLVRHADTLGCITQPLTDSQRAAFLSFAFNMGEGAFCKSTLVRKANAGDVQGACAELSR